MQSCIRQLRYSAVTLDLKNNSFHLLLKHSLQPTFMITEWRQTSNLHLGISRFRLSTQDLGRRHTRSSHYQSFGCIPGGSLKFYRFRLSEKKKFGRITFFPWLSCMHERDRDLNILLHNLNDGSIFSSVIQDPICLLTYDTQPNELARSTAVLQYCGQYCMYCNG